MHPKKTDVGRDGPARRLIAAQNPIRTARRGRCVLQGAKKRNAPILQNRDGSAKRGP